MMILRERRESAPKYYLLLQKRRGISRFMSLMRRVRRRGRHRISRMKEFRQFATARPDPCLRGGNHSKVIS